MAAEGSFGIAEIWDALRFGAGPAAFVVLYGLFAKLEDIASPDAKRDIAAWLKRAEVPGALVNWPSQFVVLFDRVFGERHVSWRCFFRSCVASLAATMVMVAAWTILRPDDVVRFVASWVRGWPVILLLVPVTAMALNCLPDYISLLQSRLVIRWMINSRSAIRSVVLLTIDFVASITIFLFAAYFFFFFIAYLSHETISKSPHLIGQVIAKVIYWFGYYTLVIKTDPHCLAFTAQHHSGSQCASSGYRFLYITIYLYLGLVLCLIGRSNPARAYG